MKRSVLIAAIIIMVISFVAVGLYLNGSLPFFAAPSPTPTPEQSPTGTYIKLKITPQITTREDTVTFVVESSLKNTLLTFEAQYEGRTEWIKFTTHNTGTNGGCSFAYECTQAGTWSVRARASNTVSNLVPVTVYGITLWQQKSVWKVGESYTAALTGTYMNWWVSIWQKNATSNTWVWSLNSQTDATGAIDYGVNSVVIDPAQAGFVKNVIAVISPNDPTGQDVWELFYQVETPGYVSDGTLNNYAQQGLIVKSNILTVTITS